MQTLNEFLRNWDWKAQHKSNPIFQRLVFHDSHPVLNFQVPTQFKALTPLVANTITPLVLGRTKPFQFPHSNPNGYFSFFPSFLAFAFPLTFLGTKKWNNQKIENPQHLREVLLECRICDLAARYVSGFSLFFSNLVWLVRKFQEIDRILGFGCKTSLTRKHVHFLCFPGDQTLSHWLYYARFKQFSFTICCIFFSSCDFWVWNVKFLISKLISIDFVLSNLRCGVSNNVWLLRLPRKRRRKRKIEILIFALLFSVGFRLKLLVSLCFSLFLTKQTMEQSMKFPHSDFTGTFLSESRSYYDTPRRRIDTM